MKNNLIEEVASSTLPLENNSNFTIKIFRECSSSIEHVALINEKNNRNKPCLVRIHSECLTGDVFGSLRCDCGEQLQKALKYISAEGGIILYMRQEGRGIGLANKINAYELQSQGMDTVEANQHLGFPEDLRNYDICVHILRLLGISKIRLMTNNPRKISAFNCDDIDVVERVPLQTLMNEENMHYLKTKRDKLGHLLDIE